MPLPALRGSRDGSLEILRASSQEWEAYLHTGLAAPVLLLIPAPDRQGVLALQTVGLGLFDWGSLISYVDLQERTIQTVFDTYLDRWQGQPCLMRDAKLKDNDIDEMYLGEDFLIYCRTEESEWFTLKLEGARLVELRKVVTGRRSPWQPHRQGLERGRPVMPVARELVSGSSGTGEFASSGRR